MDGIMFKRGGIISVMSLSFLLLSSTDFADAKSDTNLIYTVKQGCMSCHQGGSVPADDIQEERGTDTGNEIPFSDHAVE